MASKSTNKDEQRQTNEVRFAGPHGNSVVNYLRILMRMCHRSHSCFSNSVTSQNQEILEYGESVYRESYCACHLCDYGPNRESVNVLSSCAVRYQLKEMYNALFPYISDYQVDHSIPDNSGVTHAHDSAQCLVPL